MNKGESPTVKRSQRKSDRGADMPGQQPSVAYSIGNKKPPPGRKDRRPRGVKDRNGL